jgi:hypothetical protein
MRVRLDTKKTKFDGITMLIARCGGFYSWALFHEREKRLTSNYSELVETRKRMIVRELSKMIGDDNVSCVEEVTTA